MSRIILHQDSKITVVSGMDQILGIFYQIFDKDFENETVEGEGLILDWSQEYGFKINLTEYPDSMGIFDIIDNYVKDYGDNIDDKENFTLFNNIMDYKECKSDNCDHCSCND